MGHVSARVAHIRRHGLNTSGSCILDLKNAALQQVLVGASPPTRHAKSRSAGHLQDLHRPAMLITEADCIGRVDPPSSQSSDFCAAVVAALRRPTGHVLIPVDTTARVLELLLLLERHWAAKGLSYPIVFLAKTAVSIVTKARAQLEFLSENVQKVRLLAARSARPCAPHAQM